MNTLVMLRLEFAFECAVFGSSIYGRYTDRQLERMVRGAAFERLQAWRVRGGTIPDVPTLFDIIDSP